MGRTIINNLVELLELGSDVLSLGVSPSGNIHVGTLVTITNALHYMAQNEGALLQIAVHDLFSTFQMGLSFLPHKYKQDTYGCHATVPQHTLSEVERFIDGMSGFLGISRDRTKIRYMSDVAYTSEFRRTLNDILQDEQKRNSMRDIVKLSDADNLFVPIHPVCLGCNHSSTRYSEYTPLDSTLRAVCLNDQCTNEVYRTNVLDTSRELVLYYLLNLIRDVVPDNNGARADVHFCGGDKLEVKGTEYGGKDLSILERGEQIMRLVTEDTPHIFVGALVTYRGRKLSKSQRTRFTFDALVNRYGGEWSAKIYQFTHSSISRTEYDIRGSCVSDMLRQG
ncbi:MAG: hypothetical protein KJ561_07990 [Nanoarchaeota archaeon]|nr:hypothetical protein [Nanoarchaeota archaeon]